MGKVKATKCPKHKKYKGVYAPRCSCDSCWIYYWDLEYLAKKIEDKMLKLIKKSELPSSISYGQLWLSVDVISKIAELEQQRRNLFK